MMSDFKVTGLCRCGECQWNNEAERWEGNTQPATDRRTLGWMLRRPVECAKCHQLLTTTAVSTPVAGTIPTKEAAPISLWTEQYGGEAPDA